MPAAVPAANLTPEQRAYQAYGAAETLLYNRRKEIILSGPAGTGKSRGCLEKLHICAQKYPRMRGLIVRKTRESLTEAALVTFEEKVLPANSPIASGAQRRMRQAYQYPNGSTIVVGGLDKAQKVMSTEYDMIYVQEAIELSENDWEALTTRLRNGIMPYQQLLADTNPDTPYHWLKMRESRGALLMLESRHEDNPTVTPDYLDTLKALTGVRHARLYLGKWVAAEGMVYEEWDRKLHMLDRFEIPRSWPRYWSIDFGFTNPFVWQAWATDPDGRLIRYKEIYMSQRLVEDHAKKIRELTRDEPFPTAVICDHDAEGRATLERTLGIKTIAAHKTVTDGIQAVKSRLKVQRDGKARLFLMRDSRVEIDPVMQEKKLPTCGEEEIDGYVWDISNGRKKGEEPVKANDHSVDAMRYMVAQLDLVGRRFQAVVGGQRPVVQTYVPR
jgi:PBSX family phage terminase large subunit